MYVTNAEFTALVESGMYWGHKMRSYYSDRNGCRIVLFPNGRVYISSELFGTDSHIGTIAEGIFKTNQSSSSELHPSHRQDDPTLMPTLAAAGFGSDKLPAVLSVSFKRLAYV